MRPLARLEQAPMSVCSVVHTFACRLNLVDATPLLSFGLTIGCSGVVFRRCRSFLPEQEVFSLICARGRSWPLEFLELGVRHVLRRPIETTRLLGMWLFDLRHGFPVDENPVSHVLSNSLWEQQSKRLVGVPISRLLTYAITGGVDSSVRTKD